MPGLGREMAFLGGKKDLALGPALDRFIAAALLDFTHMTVLMYMVREARGGCSVGDIAKFIGDPKRVIQQVLDRFLGLELVRVSGGIFKKYAYQREGPRAGLVVKLLKLWEHPEGHQMVLRKILEPKS